MKTIVTRKRQLGAATAIDFVLTFPLFAVLMLFIIQMALVLHAYTVIHYSAYKAARAARVHVLNSDHAFLELDYPGWADAILSIPNGVKLGDALLGDGSATDLIDGDLRERVNGAAMNALISISPASRDYAFGAPGASWHPDSVNDFLTAASVGYPNRVGPLTRKARYAYTDANTEVEYKFINFQNPVLQEIEDAWRVYDTVSQTALHSQVEVPITVTVSYRYELQIPIGQVFFANDTSRRDGRKRFARRMEATVKLM